MRSSCLTLAAVLVAAAPPALAQTDSSATGAPNATAAYSARTGTPIGALPPMFTLRDVGMGGRALGFRVQFGNIDEQGSLARRGFAAGIDVPVGTSATVGFTAGYDKYACDESDLTGGDPTIDASCKGAFMAGANVSAPLLRSPVGGDASTFTLGLDGALGFASGEVLTISAPDGVGGELHINLSNTLMSAALALPLSLAVKYPNAVLVPHLRPGVGYGRAKSKYDSNIPFLGSGEETESGTRFMLGGGLAVLMPRYGLGLDVGVQKVFIEDGKTLVGVGLTFGR